MTNLTVTKEQIDNLMSKADITVRTEYNKATLVSVQLENGFVLTECSACVDPKNYDENTGTEICLRKIEDKLWELEGYVLQKKVHEMWMKNGVTFGDALEHMKKGGGARLHEWKPDVVIKAQFPDENSKMTAPYLYVESRYGRVPWKETMIELFSNEWVLV